MAWLFAIIKILFGGKLSREKTFMNFAILEPPVKVFSAKFGSTIPTCDTFYHSTKGFFHKMVTYRSVKVFSLESFALYSSCLAIVMAPFAII